MPSLFGKLEEKARRRLRWYDRYHTTVWAMAILILVGFAVYSGVTAIVTSGRVEEQGRDINVIRQTVEPIVKSPCTVDPKTDKPREPAQCHQDFSQAIALITSLQACEIFEKGSDRMTLNGKTVRVKCIRSRKSSRAGPASSDRSAAAEPSSESEGGEPIATTEPPASGAEPPPAPTAPANEGGGGGGGGKHQPSKPGGSPPAPAPTPTPVPTPTPTPAPSPEPAPGNGEGNNGKGNGNGGGEVPNPGNGGESGNSSGSSAVGVRVLPEEGSPVEVEVLPEVVQLPICTPLIKVNCQPR